MRLPKESKYCTIRRGAGWGLGGRILQPKFDVWLESKQKEANGGVYDVLHSRKEDGAPTVEICCC